MMRRVKELETAKEDTGITNSKDGWIEDQHNDEEGKGKGNSKGGYMNSMNSKQLRRAEE